VDTTWIPRLLGLGCLGAFVLVFAAGGVYLIYRAVKSTQESKASQSWPSTVGHVVEARVRESTSTDSDGDSQTRYSPYVKYEYDVAGRSYLGERLVFGPIATSPRPNKIQAVLGRYPPGTQVTVYYDPENPKDAVLERRAGAVSASVIVGIALLCVSACLCVPGVGSILFSLLPK
jgi:hypothetical protein